MKMRIMSRKRAEMSNHRYDLPDVVGMTSYRCDYTPDEDSYLPYRGW